jgi:hypothetical protein
MGIVGQGGIGVPSTAPEKNVIQALRWTTISKME